ncbi:MAG: ribosome maturation factor RimM [Flavobacteriales bacterium]
MDLDNLHHLGRLGKPWGNRGELTLHLEEADFDELQELGVLFAEIDGQRVPFHVIHLREHPRTGAVVLFEDFADPQSVAFLVGCEIFAPPGHEPPTDTGEDEENLDPSEFIGMKVLDVEYGELGDIVGTEGTEDHPVMVVRKGEQEILIPLVDDMITGIDLDTGHLIVRTPPGLVDLYRGL